MGKNMKHDNGIKQMHDVQVSMVQTDMNRIDDALLDGSKEKMQALHIELDGTYQNIIQSWGSGTYNYILGHGYDYNYMDEGTLRDNLMIIKGKLRGLLMLVAPNIEGFSSTNMEPHEKKKTEDAELRANMYDVIKKQRFDVAKEYARIWKLFNTGDIVGPRETPISLQLEGCIQFFPDTFKRRALTLADFNEIYGFEFDPPNEMVTTDQLISYCEYVVTLCDYLWEYASDHLEDDTDYLSEALYQTVESCMDELGLVSAKREGITIYVDKDPAVIAVAEIVDESLAYDVKAFTHKQTKGDLQRKKTILKFLADDIEPQRKTLDGINKRLSGNLFQMLQKFVRHNNEDNPYIKSLSPAEIETNYDDIYQMWLLAKLELDNLERKGRVEEVLRKINA